MWRLPNYYIDNFDRLDRKFLEFALNQAEKLLIETVKSGEDITRKAYTLLGISVTIMTLSLGLYFNIEDEESTNYMLVVADLILGTFAFIAILILTPPLLSYSAHVAGSSSKEILTTQSIEGFLESENSIKNILLSECVNYQRRIDFNQALNKKRILYVDLSMFILVASPFVSAVITAFIGRACGSI